MNKNQWDTMQTLLKVEINRYERTYDMENGALAEIYERWVHKVQQHVKITDYVLVTQEQRSS